MWNVLFYRDAQIEIEPKNVAISATNIGWNDFGYNYNAFLGLKINGMLYNFQIMLLPFSVDKAEAAVSNWIDYLISATAKEQPWRDPNKVFPHYITVFSSITAYQDLARLLPQEEYEDLLKSVWEINSVLDNKIISSEVYRKIVESPQFVAGVLRNTGPYKSFRFGYFSANRMPPPDDARTPFSFSTKLDGFSTPHTINFNYKDLGVMSDRIHCLIGVNGVGKTRYINNLVLNILKKINSVATPGCISELYDANGNIIPPLPANNIDNWNELPQFSRVTVYSTDPHNFLPRSTNLKGSFDYKYFDMGLEGSVTLARLLGDIIRSEELIGVEDRFVLLKKIIPKIIPAAQLLIPVLPTLENSSKIIDSNKKHWIPIGAIRGGELRKLEIIGNIDSDRDLAFQIGQSLTTPLSSGQKMYFRFATHFLTSASKGMLVLIDEPETHLHPNLVTEFMNLLYLVLEATSSAAIIATHSAYVVREVPSHCAHVIQSDSAQKITVSNVYLNTLGASVSALSNAVFGDSLVQSFSDKIAAQIAQSENTLEAIIERYKPILSMDMLVKIRELMKD
ncbi:AAA family ATPase [Pseudomonas protegens]|uniref:AAA family ATPase n=1 Tax=Pseudomonas protegens TaxID=380021 RepID=UPI001B315393|nr:AAA family ATPase [Pseudomonas protegens]MBP5100305.1 ATP-binding protein [Pseudomonas protegens]MBP5127050.1 ATP-binding protein [Pseudomonas protegens]QTU06408.1 ATP-binding protein [Pseudomonas protegens]QTU12718.1 ATP-binding protein [Pseudomonas protegens]QTU39904.1 ATP-binding protein [Pseudomonas protegens]